MVGFSWWPSRAGVGETSTFTSLSHPPVLGLVPPSSQARGKGSLVVQSLQTSLPGPRAGQRKVESGSEETSRKYTGTHSRWRHEGLRQ